MDYTEEFYKLYSMTNDIQEIDEQNVDGLRLMIPNELHMLHLHFERNSSVNISFVFFLSYMLYYHRNYLEMVN